MNRTPRDYCERHGIDYRLYSAWVEMRRRCHNPNCRSFKDYGGRGITICERWDDFINFAIDMEPHPGEGWLLDRIDNEGNYSKGNCRWVTASTSVRNRRCTVLSDILVLGIRADYTAGEGSYNQLAVKYGVSKATIADVVKRRWWR